MSGKTKSPSFIYSLKASNTVSAPPSASPNFSNNVLVHTNLPTKTHIITSKKHLFLTLF